MKDTITRDVNAAVRAVAGVTDVDLTLGVMSAEQRGGLKELLSDGKAQRDIQFAQPGSLTKVFAIASGKGGVGKSSVTVNLALAMAGQGLKVGVVDADIYGHSVPAMLGVADAKPTQVEDLIMPVPTDVRRLGDLDRHAQAAPRPGRRLARADARPGAGPDARRRLLGRPRRAAPRPAARHRRRRDLARPAPARRRGGRGHHAAGGRRRGGRAGRHDGLDDAPARGRRGREHVATCPARTAPRRARTTGSRCSAPAAASGSPRRCPAGSATTCPLLGQIPLDIALREGGDAGKPIVDVRPDRARRRRARSIADTLAGRDRGLAGMQLGLTPAGRL